mmetsp:Transcript_20919/g.32068  ORF Transcript_20919/g.32068 Transcript_20919/m.32068 type:complete len:416 (-) Transcript_20919:244-1491(-)
MRIKNKKLRLAFARVAVYKACKRKRLGLSDCEKMLRKALRLAQRWGTQKLWKYAAENLALLFLQSHKKRKGERLLRLYNPEVKFRLSNEVLRSIDLPRQISSKTSESSIFVVYDNALCGLAQLRQAFLTPDFWRAHNYVSSRQPRQFFSYCHSLNEYNDHAVTATTARVILQILKPDFPQLAQAQYVEWWSHRRPRCSGHQLHFDSDDEGQYQLRHPIVTAILFFDDIGGPTLLTTQKPNDHVLHRHGAHLIFPRRHRILAFLGDRLHSVLPISPTATQPNSAFRQRRTTLMLAYWSRLTRIRPFTDAPASAVAFPPLSILSSSATSTFNIRNAWIRKFYCSDHNISNKRSQPRSTPHLLSSRRSRLPGIIACRTPLWTPLLTEEELENKTTKRKKEDDHDLIPLPPYEACFQGY